MRNAKRKAAILAGLLMILFSCTKKSLPVITERKTEPPRPAAEASIGKNIIADTATGRALFVSRCNRCHGLPEPAQYTSPRWESILSSMIPKARLNTTEAAHLRSYLYGYAAK